MNTQEQIDQQRSVTTAAPEANATGPTSPAPSDSAYKATSRKAGRRKAFLIFFLVLLVAGAAALLYWLNSRQFESTDDAQIDAHLNPVTSRVDGTITEVYVDDKPAGYTPTACLRVPIGEHRVHFQMDGQRSPERPLRITARHTPDAPMRLSYDFNTGRFLEP